MKTQEFEQGISKKENIKPNFKKLENMLQKEAGSKLKKYIKTLTDKKEGDNCIKRDSPYNSVRFDKLNRTSKIEYLVTKEKKYLQKNLDSDLKKLEDAKEAEDIDSIMIVVEWKKSRVWGANPKATIVLYTKKHIRKIYTSRSVSGCGYDKLSTSISQALNQIPELMKLIYIMKNKNITKKNNEIFGYGMCSGILPSFEEGCGVSCYRDNFKAIGMRFESGISTKNIDTFQVTNL